jgi:hypothetical protein
MSVRQLNEHPQALIIAAKKSGGDGLVGHAQGGISAAAQAL